eukprot:219423-Chlamydomonas_euryale.AAC.1
MQRGCGAGTPVLKPKLLCFQLSVFDFKTTRAHAHAHTDNHNHACARAHAHTTPSCTPPAAGRDGPGRGHPPRRHGTVPELAVCEDR